MLSVMLTEIGTIFQKSVFFGLFCGAFTELIGVAESSEPSADNLLFLLSYFRTFLKRFFIASDQEPWEINDLIV
jgi:hypothetical protein